MIPTSIAHLTRPIGSACALLLLLLAAYVTVPRVASSTRVSTSTQLRSGVPVALGLSHPAFVMAIAPGGHLSAMRQSSTISVRVGQEFRVLISNADSANRILSIPALGIYKIIAGARSSQPSMTAVSVTPRRVGRYTWRLLPSCSGGASTSGGIVVR